MGRHVPRKRFGQHFLHDPRVLARIVEAIAPAREDAMLEIGPGEGALTRALLERVRTLHAVEIDRDLAARLEEAFPRERLIVHRADALELELTAFPPELRVVGNLPYNVSTPLLFHLASQAERVRDLHFMLQLEVVERMVSAHSSPAYGRLSVMLQARFRMQKLFRVPAGAFHPPPQVESAFVRMIPLALNERPRVDLALLGRLVAGAFAARRKTLRNALPLSARDFEQLTIDPRLRPENLAPADYVRIAQHLMSQVR